MIFAAMLTACSGSGDGVDNILRSVDYYPARIEGRQLWYMIGTDGCVAAPDSFPSAPSVAVKGVFSALTTDGMTVCRINADGSLATIARGLRYAGAMVNDRMPVCRPDSAISVIGPDGAQLFSLGNLDGHNYNACSAFFTYGLLTVRDRDTNLWGAIDRDGRLTIEPKYDYITPFNCSHAIATREGRLFIVDTDGKETMPADGEFEPVSATFLYDHAILQRRSDSRRVIIDTDGNIAELDASLMPIMLAPDGTIFINRAGELGVMGFDGHVAIVPALRSLLSPIGGSDLILCEDAEGYSILEPDGETRLRFGSAVKTVVPLYGGRIMACSDAAKSPTGIPQGPFTLVNSDMKPLGSLRFSEIDKHLALTDILLSDREQDHNLFNTADPGNDLPDWMEPDEDDDDSHDSTTIEL